MLSERRAQSWVQVSASAAAHLRLGARAPIPPSDRAISVEAITIHRIVGGKIAEEWTVWDALGLLRQIGAVPAAA